MKLRKFAAALAAAIMAGTLLAGCACSTRSKTTESGPVAQAIVVGIHANACQIPLSAASIHDALYNAAYTKGSVAFVRCDGAPGVYYQASIPADGVDGLSKEKQASIAEDYTAALQQALTQVSVTAPEVDTLESIRLSAQALRAENTEVKKLLVLDTGLSTTGYLNFTQGLLNASAEEIVKRLSAASAIPDLRGVNVTWCFCGETAAPQSALTEAEKQNLRTIWQSVLLAGGASGVTFSEDFPAADPYTDLPAVSTVPTGARTIDSTGMETVVLDSTSVSFVGDSAEFADAARAAEAVSGTAQQLLAHPGTQVYVVGCTAGGQDAAFCRSLSAQRAEAVSRLLVQEGVPAEQLITVGLGASDPWHQSDLDENGALIEEIAMRNRSVRIVDITGSDGAQIAALL